MPRGSSLRILIIGAGKMGAAIAAGLIGSTDASGREIGAADIGVVHPREERRCELSDQLGVTAYETAFDAPLADIVILAVKPQVMPGLLRNLVEGCAFEGADPLFVSIAAGLTTEALEAELPENARVVRVMPNMPLAISAGATGVCAGSKASEQDVVSVRDLFECLGKAVVVDESQMDAVCAVSGSGPAYVAAFIEALRDAGQKEGLDAELAEALALQTVLGTARYIDETGFSVAQTRESICSPGGTTLAALDAMQAERFSDVIAAGVAAAVSRSKELAQCS